MAFSAYIRAKSDARLVDRLLPGNPAIVRERRQLLSVSNAEHLHRDEAAKAFLISERRGRGPPDWTALSVWRSATARRWRAAVRGGSYWGSRPPPRESIAGIFP